MTFKPILLLFFAFSFLDFALSRTDDNAFTFPTASGPALNYVGNLDFELGSTQKVQWITNLTSYKIEMWQQRITTNIGYAVETVFTANGDRDGEQHFEWDVQTYSSNLTFSPIYFFWLNPNTASGFSCHYFNISEVGSSSSQSTSTTSSSMSTHPTTTSEASVAAADTPASATTTAATVQPSDSTAADTAASSSVPSTSNESDPTVNWTALGVGLGVGIPLVLVVGIWVGLRARGGRLRSSRSTESFVPLAKVSKQSWNSSHLESPEAVHYPGDCKQHAEYRISPAELAPKTPAELGS